MSDRIVEFKIKFDSSKEYIPILKSDYVLKINNNPKKGLLIDLYMPLPNPYFIDKIFNKNVTYFYNTTKLYTKVFVARHWPKKVNEEHMLILLPYIIDNKEKLFQGERLTHPIGNYKIVEKGEMYLLSFFKRSHMFFYIIYLQRKIGILPLSQGSVYAIYLDILQPFSTSNIMRWTKEPLYLRNQRIFTGKPKIKINELRMIQSSMLRYFHNINSERL